MESILLLQSQEYLWGLSETGFSTLLGAVIGAVFATLGSALITLIVQRDERKRFRIQLQKQIDLEKANWKNQNTLFFTDLALKDLYREVDNYDFLLLDKDNLFYNYIVDGKNMEEYHLKMSYRLPHKIATKIDYENLSLLKIDARIEFYFELRKEMIIDMEIIKENISNIIYKKGLQSEIYKL